MLLFICTIFTFIYVITRKGEIIMYKINIQEENPHGTPYFPFQALSQEDFCGQYFAPYHWHEETEFIYITKGSLMLRTETNSQLLTQGNVYFINPGMVHGIFGHSEVSHHYALLFPMSFLSFSQYDICQNELLTPLLSKKLLFPEGSSLSLKISLQIGSLISKAARLYLEDTSANTALSIKIILLQILEILFQEHAFSSAQKHEAEKDFENHSLKSVFSYIEKHYMEPVTLEALAECIPLNKNYFCKFFKEKVGKTPFAYLNEYRINQAAAQLLKTTAPITEVALNNGYENISYFVRQFKHYKHCTPSDFRTSAKFQSNLISNSVNQ